ncbi:MICOS complex subunit MIC27-like [Alosa pseudoharengus]|uniref:MICOS complex subunit MIC27-like n=1 Tax=Alosa pseudoharengus TaxID=34774 RepID=UPI003F8A02EC
MSPKLVKFVAVPATAILGIASFRVHYVTREPNVEGLLTPHQLSIYTPLPQKFQYVAEQQGALQSHLGIAREWLQSYVRAVKGSLLSAKVRTVNLYHAGEDVYHYLKDPPPGFLPRVGFISGAGLTGLILARRGSRLRRLLLPLGLASLGAGICYPAPTLAFLKVTGRQAWAASQWSMSAVSTLWRSEPSEHHPARPPPSSSPPPPSSSPPPPAPAPAAPTTHSKPSQSRVPKPSVPHESPPSDLAAEDATLPSSPAAPQDSGKGPAVPTSRPEQPLPLPLLLPLAPPPPLTAPAESTRPAGKPGFTADPQLMDFGQSNPEDADLYSTRS